VHMFKIVHMCAQLLYVVFISSIRLVSSIVHKMAELLT